MVIGGPVSKKGTVGSIVQFNKRIAPPGTRYFYASIEPDVLGVVLHHTLGKSLSDYVQEKVWQQIGAEADARWLVDDEGLELAHAFFNGVLRDYARLIIPREWMIAATTVRAADTVSRRARRRRNWLRLFAVVVRRRAAAIRAAGLSRTTHLRRSGLKADPGSDRVGPTDELSQLWTALSEQFA
jgi:CubicO group peptidase (beta-lactamase class C family)